MGNRAGLFLFLLMGLVWGAMTLRYGMTPWRTTMLLVSLCVAGLYAALALAEGGDDD